jgi:hypothetical protein
LSLDAESDELHEVLAPFTKLLEEVVAWKLFGGGTWKLVEQLEEAVWHMAGRLMIARSKARAAQTQSEQWEQRARALGWKEPFSG